MTEPDPFALPAPSTSRLRLLFVTVGAAAFFSGHWFLVLAHDGWRARSRECAGLADVAAFLDCSTRTLVLQTLAPLTGPLLVAALVLVAYLAAPAVITLRHRAVPLKPWPEALRKVVSAAGLRRPPELMLSARGWKPWMFTYGRRPRHRVMLSRSIRAYASTDSSAVSATLAHELGHLLNRDVDRTYLARFAVTGFTLTAVPMALSVATTLEAGQALAVGWRMAVMWLLVAGTFAAVIRSREHDADLRAAAFRPEEMLTLLSRGREERGRTLRLHPPLGERLEALRDPGRLLLPSIAEAATAGVAAGVALVELGAILHILLPVPPPAAYWLAGTMVAVPVTGITGLGVWRGALVRPRAVGRALASGFALGAGLLAGAALAPRTSVNWARWLTGAPDQTAVAGLDRIPPVTLVWLAGTLVLLTTAIGGWLALAARSWLPAAGPVAWRYTAPVAAALYAVVMGTWFVAARLAASQEWRPDALATLVIPPQVAIVLSALLVVAVLTLWPLVRRAPLAAAVAVAVAVAPPAAYAALPDAPPRPQPRPDQVELPDSTHAGAICLGLYTQGVAVMGTPEDHAAKERLGRLLGASDDRLLREIGAMFLRSATTRSAELAAVAWTAFVRRCDHLNRYPDAPVPHPSPPFPTEGW